MDDGMAIESVHGRHDAILEFLFGCDADGRSTEPASLEKKPSTILSQEPCVGVKTNSKRPAG
jgi:hypothetical protein